MGGREAALVSYAEQERIMDAAVRAALMIWAELDPRRFSASWLEDRIADRIFLTTARAQDLAAMAAEQATGLILAEAAHDVQAEARVNTSALAGVASDGRDLGTLLDRSVITASVAGATGSTPADALSMGASVLTRIVATQVQDAGRAATGLSIAVRPSTGWVRLVEPGACSRCIVLAGRFYRWSSGFDRHPLCKCRNIPAAEDTEDLTPESDPMTHFNSLSEEEQNRQFTKAGAESIRHGADIFRVVNARRGALGLDIPGRLTVQERQAGKREGDRFRHLQRVDVYGRPLYTTTEATTAYSDVGRRLNGKAPRLMPEAIFEIATDREDAIKLLRRFGYLF